MRFGQQADEVIKMFFSAKYYKHLFETPLCLDRRLLFSTDTKRQREFKYVESRSMKDETHYTFPLTPFYSTITITRITLYA